MIPKHINISLYYSNSCGHCIKFKPAWEQIKKYITNAHNKNITFNEYNENEIKNKEIAGFPTILFAVKMKNINHEVEYTGSRNARDIIDVIQQIRKI